MLVVWGFNLGAVLFYFKLFILPVLSLTAAWASIAVASLAAEHRLCFHNCGSQAPGNEEVGSCDKLVLFFHEMWDLPGPGIKPACSALVGGFFTTEPPGEPYQYHFECHL